MDKLSTLLHELIEATVPAGNKRGELHALADELGAVPGEGTAAEVPAAAKAADAKAVVPPRLPAAVFSAPVVPGGPAQP